MFTPYDRKQQAAERAAYAARTEAARIAAQPAVLVVPSCDWDAELAKLLAPEGGASA